MRKLRLREWRTFREMSQADLADRARIRQQTVSDIETGRSNPLRMTLAALAQALGCSATDLYRKPKE